MLLTTPDMSAILKVSSLSQGFDSVCTCSTIALVELQTPGSHLALFQNGVGVNVGILCTSGHKSIHVFLTSDIACLLLPVMTYD